MSRLVTGLACHGTHGNFTIIGSPLDDNGLLSGSAYIYDYKWDKFSKITANDGAKWDRFGYSVAMCHNVAVVGSRGDDRVYIFEYNTEMGTWNQTAKLTASDGASNDYFGTSVGISYYCWNRYRW